mmetsp:Transcript_25954/g.36769  ORF Transcript_25954/g.36769 Transcript_25954/m.36769 type:complete len:207 (+) Transcript_25954:372-992(+)
MVFRRFLQNLAEFWVLHVRGKFVVDNFVAFLRNGGQHENELELAAYFGRHLVKKLRQNENGNVDVPAVSRQTFQTQVVHHFVFAAHVVQNEREPQPVVLRVDSSALAAFDGVVHADVDRFHDVRVLWLENEQLRNVMGPVLLQPFVLGDENDEPVSGGLDVLVDEPAPRCFSGVAFAQEQVEPVFVVQSVEIEAFQPDLVVGVQVP